MRLIDMHCDTIFKLMDVDKCGDFMKNQCCVSIPAMKEANSLAQFFACFTYLGDYAELGGYEKCYEHVQEMITYMERQAALFSGDIKIAYSFDDIKKCEEEKKIAAILTVEEGGILNGKMERLEQLYERGIRLMTLMWNYENCLGHPNSKDPSIMQKGLKKFGWEVLERMGEIGMIVDVSHASDGVFWEIVNHAKAPVVASHSNCRELCNHPRNLSDEMIRALADKGGVAGLNLYGVFLGARKESRIDEMVAHLLHMIQIGGSEFPAIGTDFDGFDGMEVMEISDISEMEKLWNALKKKGVAESQLDKIWSGNVMRILGGM